MLSGDVEACPGSGLRTSSSTIQPSIQPSWLSRAHRSSTSSRRNESLDEAALRESRRRLVCPGDPRDLAAAQATQHHRADHARGRDACATPPATRRPRRAPTPAAWSEACGSTARPPARRRGPGRRTARLVGTGLRSTPVSPRARYAYKPRTLDCRRAIVRAPNRARRHPTERPARRDEAPTARRGTRTRPPPSPPPVAWRPRRGRSSNPMPPPATYSSGPAPRRSPDSHPANGCPSPIAVNSEPRHGGTRATGQSKRAVPGMGPWALSLA